jgi:hypothetical protein
MADGGLRFIVVRPVRVNPQDVHVIVDNDDDEVSITGESQVDADPNLDKDGWEPALDL